jgi:hypothetical protein
VVSCSIRTSADNLERLLTVATHELVNGHWTPL